MFGRSVAHIAISTNYSNFISFQFFFYFDFIDDEDLLKEKAILNGHNNKPFAVFILFHMTLNARTLKDSYREPEVQRDIQ